MKLDDYRTLGKTGLAVSPLCLGTMTFGTAWGWGADEQAARAMFDRYVDLGGNFVDTAEEAGETLTSLVHAGKVRYVGLSDVPAWYAARYQTLAEKNGWARVAALQLEYSLVERSIEREHVPAARELGIAVIPWSPLSNGFLAGKYKRDDAGAKGEGRLGVFAGSGNAAFAERARPSEKMWTTLDAVKAIAAELGRTPAEVSLAWVYGRPGVTSTLLGATRVAQLEANIAAGELELPAAARARLDEVSALEVVHPYGNFTESFQGMIYGGARVAGWRL